MRRRSPYRSVPSRVVDVLDTVGVSLTLAELESEYRFRFGPVEFPTLERACRRLTTDGVLSTTRVENPLNPTTSQLTFRRWERAS